MSNLPFDLNNLFPWYEPAITPKPVTPSFGDMLRNLQSEPPAKPFDLSILDGIWPKLTLRPRIFVSYQHSSDQYYYNEFSRIFHDSYESVFDNSLERSGDFLDRIQTSEAKQDFARIFTQRTCHEFDLGKTKHERPRPRCGALRTRHR